MKILYVEDEEALSMLISMEIESELGCEVVQISSGNKAIDWLEKNDFSKINLIVSDNKMPDGSGATLFQYVKKNTPQIPFLLTTGSANATEHLDFEGFTEVNSKNDILVKPFHLEKLTQKIKEILKL